MQKLYSYPLLVCFVAFNFFLQSVSAQSPMIASFSPVNGAAGTLVTITGTNLASPTSLKIGGIAAIAISNTGTKLVAMVMPGAITGAVTIVTAHGSVNGSGNFTLSASKAPNTQQGSKLVGTGVVGSSPNQGTSLAVSADGNTAIVGGPDDNNNAGAAWIFTRSNGTWSQQGAKLVGSNAVYVGSGSAQGVSVAISADGNTVAIGGRGDNGGVGAVWVFTRTNGVWAQQGDKLVASDAINSPNAATQGNAVSISADGNTLIEGGTGDNNNTGAAWIFTHSNGVWSEVSKLVGSGAINGTSGSGAEEGTSVSISADGNTAVIGGATDNNGAGAIWVFVQSKGVWSQQGNKLIGTGAVSASQGLAVSVSADGNTMIEGGGSDNNGIGASWVFTRTNNVWSQQGSKLVGTGAVNGQYGASQGYSVSLSADGNIAMIGGSSDNNGAGATWMFARTGSVWAEAPHNKLVGSGAINGQYGADQGNAVSISADGTTALTGGNYDNNGVGAAWVFTYVNIPAPTITSFTPASGRAGTLVTISGSNLTNLTSVTVGGVSAIPISNSATVVTALVMPGSATGTVLLKTFGGTVKSTSNFTITAPRIPNAQEGSKLVGKDTIGVASQGQSIAISADGNTAAVGGYNDNGGVGAVWIFTRSNGVWAQQGKKLTGTGAIGNANLGSSVAISADGNTVIAGGYGDNANAGAAWVFTRTGSVWTQQGAKLTGSDAAGAALQGVSVSLSADGNTAVVGGSWDNDYTGAAWVYSRTGGTWAQQGSKMVGSENTAVAEEGISVAISADGNTIVTGADNYTNGGAAWVFTNSSGAWAQQGTVLQGTGISNALNSDAAQGWATSISADGNTFIMGGPDDNGGDGAAWIFTRSAGSWSQQGKKLVARDTTGAAYQGWAVSISADGNNALIGGSNNNNGAGAAWIFSRNGGVWAQHGNKLVGTGAVNGIYGTGQGWSASLSADANTAIVGGVFDNNGAGAAWVFTDSSTALPVTITNFNAYKFGKGVQTEWQGYDETNLAGYDIERSANGHQFTSIGNVAAKDNATENNYTWFDESPLKGDNYYRIKAISKDGEIQYSTIVKINFGNTEPAMLVYPNPVINKTVQMQLNNIDAGTYGINVYSITGQSVYRQEYAHADGNALVALKLNNVAPGIYLVEMKGVKSVFHTSILVK